MGFGDLKSAAGLKALNEYLGDRTYIEGYQPSQADSVVFAALSNAPSADLYHALRWFKHIKSYGSETNKFPGQKKALSEYGAPGSPADEKKDDKKADDDDDDEDLFGSDDDDEDAFAGVEAAKKAAMEKKQGGKPGLIAKSNIIFDIKPWDDETDMKALEKHVREISTDGLLWGSSKLVAVAYGIQKLQICCVVEDEKVGTDFLEEEITKNEDLVQSVDIAAFNKV